ncbi:MAG: right-handed parallel beta-helix repeat-containing protein [Actinomycetota bacterium]
MHDLLDRLPVKPGRFVFIALGLGMLIALPFMDGWFRGDPEATTTSSTIPPDGDDGGRISAEEGTAEMSAASSQFVQLVPPQSGDLIGARDLPSQDRHILAGCEEAVAIQAPANDLASVVSGSEPGTCFSLAAGEYRFSGVVPKDYMTFLGSGRDEVVVVGDGGKENAFSGTAHSVTIAQMTFRDFTGNGGEKLQEQAPIRGTRGIWLSDRGEMATDWLIEDIVASDNAANGLFLGDHFTVRNSVFNGNGIAGIGGSELVGGLLVGNQVFGNGANQASGALINGAGMKFTGAGTPEAPLVVSANEVYENIDNGIWCDIGCNGFEVIDNFIHDHRSRAVMIELSSNTYIADNLIVDSNTWTDYGRDFNAGAITVAESSNSLVEGNYIDGAKSGIIVRQTRRPGPSEGFLNNYQGVTFVAADIVVRDNSIRDTEAMGVSTGVTGNGLINDLGSIRFEGNNYAGASGMAFWWAGQTRLSYDAWLAAGRDGGGGTSVGEPPVWPPEPEPIVADATGTGADTGDG